MKVIIIGPAHPLRGGIANFTESLAIAFLKNSFDTQIVSFSLQYPSFLFPGKTQLAEGKGPVNLKIRRLINSINPYTWLKTARYVLNESPDIVVVQFWLPYMALCLGSILHLVRRNRKTKIIAIMHNVRPHEKRMLDEGLIKYFVHTCHGFVCLSKSVLSELEEFTDNKNKIFAAHPVYDIFGDKIAKEEARRFLNLSDSDRIILFFGIIRPYKGLDLLLEALAKDELKALNIKLLVAGEFYENKQLYIQLIEKLGIQSNVILIDRFIPNEEVKYYFCAADLVVQPYKSATQSGVTQIAYNFERPMLVTNVGGLSEIVFDNHTGYVTEVDANSIARAIADFYINQREEQMSQNVQMEQYRFSWHAMVDAITQLSEQIEKG